jgi:hypothetical protein
MGAQVAGAGQELDPLADVAGAVQVMRNGSAGGRS